MSILFKSINSEKLLSQKEELELFNIIEEAKNSDSKNDLKKARKAKDKLVVSNMRLVIWKAKEYKNAGLTFDDLVQEGTLGLIKAIEKFDCKKGFRFSTYAVHWIRQSILNAISEQTHTIKLSSSQIDTLNKINHLQRDNMQLFGENLNVISLSKILGIDEKEIQYILFLAAEPYSINAMAGGDTNDLSKNPLLSDNGMNLADQLTINDDLKKTIMKVLSQLSKKEQAIIAMNFGLMNDQIEMTFEEIAQTLKISETLVKNIAHNAILKLKATSNIKELEEFINY